MREQLANRRSERVLKKEKERQMYVTNRQMLETN